MDDAFLLKGWMFQYGLLKCIYKEDRRELWSGDGKVLLAVSFD